MSRTRKHRAGSRDIWGKFGAPHGSPTYSKHARKRLIKKVRRLGKLETQPTQKAEHEN